jgi:hypothetical protein
MHRAKDLQHDPCTGCIVPAFKRFSTNTYVTSDFRVSQPPLTSCFNLCEFAAHTHTHIIIIPACLHLTDYRWVLWFFLPKHQHVTRIQGSHCKVAECRSCTHTHTLSPQVLIMHIPPWVVVSYVNAMWSMHAYPCGYGAPLCSRLGHPHRSRCPAQPLALC